MEVGGYWAYIADPPNRLSSKMEESICPFEHLLMIQYSLATQIPLTRSPTWPEIMVFLSFTFSVLPPQTWPES